MSTFRTNCSLVDFSHLFSSEVDSHPFSVLWVDQCKVRQKQNFGITAVHWLSGMYSCVCMHATCLVFCDIVVAASRLPRTSCRMIPLTFLAVYHRGVWHSRKICKVVSGEECAETKWVCTVWSLSCGRGCNCIVQSSSILVSTMRTINH